MEINRRVGQGRVAEIAGPDLVSVDRFIRTLGLYPLAQTSFAALSPWAQQRLQAYSDGVNAFLDSHRERAAARIPHPRRQARAVEAGRLAGLGQADVAAAQQQLRAGGVARALAQKLPARAGALAVPHAEGGLAGHDGAGRHADHAGLDDTRDRLGALLPDEATAPRTNGSSPARAPSPASRSSPTIRISNSARRSSGISRASSRRKARSRAAPSRDRRSSCSARTTASPGA